MAYLYHWVPEGMQGTVLYPLNALKEKHPEAYAKHAAKYEGRGHVMQMRVPVLDCLWNDVLHLTAVPPAKVKAAMIEAGRQGEFAMTCYRIDPALLDPSKTVVYVNAFKLRSASVEENEILPFVPAELGAYEDIPAETKEYYRQMFAAGKRPLAFLGIAHILHRGPIDVSGLPIVTA